MKTLKLFMFAIVLSIIGSAFAQSTKPASKTSMFLVQVPHTKEQCMNMMTGMKDKGDAFLSKFHFGCMSGDHTAYAFLEGASEETIKQMLPPDVQKSAKIEKVDKFTAAQIEQMHKDHM